MRNSDCLLLASVLALAGCATTEKPVHFTVSGDEIISATIRADTSNCDPVHGYCPWPDDYGPAECSYVNSYLLEATCEQKAVDIYGKPFVIVTRLERETQYSEWFTKGPATTYRP